MDDKRADEKGPRASTDPYHHEPEYKLEKDFRWPSAKDIKNAVDDMERGRDSWFSGMDHFMLTVTNGVRNAKVYTELSVSGTQFQAVFVAIAEVNGRLYISSYITSKLSIGMSGEQVKRDATPVIKSLIHSLGEAVFGSDSDGLDPSRFDVLSIEKHGSV